MQYIITNVVSKTFNMVSKQDFYTSSKTGDNKFGMILLI